jgi:hypothetical protein
MAKAIPKSDKLDVIIDPDITEGVKGLKSDKSVKGLKSDKSIKGLKSGKRLKSESF